MSPLPLKRPVSIFAKRLLSVMTVAMICSLAYFLISLDTCKVVTRDKITKYISSPAATLAVSQLSFRASAINQSTAHQEQPHHKVATERFCSKASLSLWTKNPEKLDISSFPACWNLFRAILQPGIKNEHLISSAVKWKIPDPHDQSSILELVSNCRRFRAIIDFPEKPASIEEAEFPLAYVFVASRNLAQTVRLFRMLYQPQNAYCITYDTKSDELYKKAVVAMASCFPSNVYLNPNPEPIYYSTYSLLHSVMECMKVLRQSPIDWRYVQVVSWNDFPLKSNWEMVKIFKTLNGSQDSELMPHDFPHYVTKERGTGHFNDNGPEKKRRPIPPDGLVWYKGSFSTSLSREFVNFMFDNPISVRFYEYINGSTFPDEFYWVTLIHNSHLHPPGGFPGECYLYYLTDKQMKPYVSRYQLWGSRWSYPKCKGKYVRDSCVFGVEDLPLLLDAKPLVAHKLYEEFQPALQYCLEEWYWQRVCVGDTRIDMTYYENLPSVQYHNLPESEKDTYICRMDVKYP